MTNRTMAVSIGMISLLAVSVILATHTVALAVSLERLINNGSERVTGGMSGGWPQNPNPTISFSNFSAGITNGPPLSAINVDGTPTGLVFSGITVARPLFNNDQVTLNVSYNAFGSSAIYFMSSEIQRNGSQFIEQVRNFVRADSDTFPSPFSQVRQFGTTESQLTDFACGRFGSFCGEGTPVRLRDPFFGGNSGVNGVHITQQIVFTNSRGNTDPITETVSFATAPEPSAVVLLATGLVALIIRIPIKLLRGH